MSCSPPADLPSPGIEPVSFMSSTLANGFFTSTATWEVLYTLHIFKTTLKASFKLIYFLLKDNCFTEFFCFLSNLNMNQPEVYIYPLPFETPSHLPPHPTPLGWYRALFEFPEPYSKFPLAIYFTYGNVSFHVTLSIHLTLSSPLPMSISLFSMSVSPLLPYK